MVTALDGLRLIGKDEDMLIKPVNEFKERLPDIAGAIGDLVPNIFPEDDDSPRHTRLDTPQPPRGSLELTPIPNLPSPPSEDRESSGKPGHSPKKRNSATEVITKRDKKRGSTASEMEMEHDEQTLLNRDKLTSSLASSSAADLADLGALNRSQKSSVPDLAMLRHSAETQLQTSSSSSNMLQRDFRTSSDVEPPELQRPHRQRLESDPIHEDEE
jgi:hypothetical protein